LFEEHLAKLFEADPGLRRHSNNWSVCERRSGEELAYFFSGEIRQVLVHQVNLRQGDSPSLDTHETDHLEVFPCLGHDAFLRSNHQQSKIYPGSACDHGVHQPLVTGHIHKVKLEVVGCELGEPEVNGDAAFLFLGKSVTIGAGEGLHQSGLAVIDVSSSSPNDMSHELMVHPLARSPRNPPVQIRPPINRPLGPFGRTR
jgi:hypothetical protein